MRLIIGNIYQGREKYARKKYGSQITVKRISLTDFDPELRAENYDVVIADEIYSGLTPIDANERKITEDYGRLLSELAAKAVSVERVVCGLASALK